MATMTAELTASFRYQDEPIADSARQSARATAPMGGMQNI
jgi:hypothetical protein